MARVSKIFLIWRHIAKSQEGKCLRHALSQPEWFDLRVICISQDKHTIAKTFLAMKTRIQKLFVCLNDLLSKKKMSEKTSDIDELVIG